MSLKFWTTVFFVFGILLAFMEPVILAVKPPKEHAHDFRVWLLEFGVNSIVLGLVWCLVAWMAFAVLKRTAQEMKESREENLKLLIEGTLRDHAPDGKKLP